LEQVPSINSPKQQAKGISSRTPCLAFQSIRNRRNHHVRAYHLIAVVAVILVGIGVKLPVFAAPIAEADSRSIESLSVAIPRMHHGIKNIQVQKFHDMSLVFPVLPGDD
jgi:hypothetical protein